MLGCNDIHNAKMQLLLLLSQQTFCLYNLSHIRQYVHTTSKPASRWSIASDSIPALLLSCSLVVMKAAIIIGQTLLIVGSIAYTIPVTPPINHVKPDETAECPGRNTTCKTLTEYLANVSTYFVSSSIFSFLCGTHKLPGILAVKNATNLSLYGTPCLVDGYSLIQCVGGTPSGMVFTDCMNIHIANLRMANCWVPTHSAATPSMLIYAALSFDTVTGIIISNMTVTESRGFGIHADSCDGETSIEGSFFIGNGNRYCLGGNARFVYRACSNSAVSLKMVGSTFSGGRTLTVPQILASSGLTVLSWCPRVNIRVESIIAANNSGGNIVFGMNSTHNNQQWSITVRDTNITDGHGSSESWGGGMLVSSSYPLSHHPEVTCDRDSTLHSVLKVINTRFTGNKANKLGAGLHLNIQESNCRSLKLEITKCLFSNNGNGAALRISKHSFPSFYKHVPVMKALLSYSQFTSNTGHAEGAVLEAANIENVHLVSCSFINNNSSAIRLQNSNLFLSGRIPIENNTAKYGAAVQFYGSSCMFFNNDTTVRFKGNVAGAMGGAIYVQDSGLDTPQPCFFQPNVDAPTQVDHLVSKNRMKLEFFDNLANIAGNAIFGGELDRCVMYGTFIQKNHSLAVSIDIYHSIFHFLGDKKDAVSSNPYRILFCQDYTPDMEKRVFPGQYFQISIVARGQLNGTTPAAISLHLSPQSQNLARMCSAQELYAHGRHCTNYSVKLEVLTEDSSSSDITAVQLVLAIKHPRLPYYKENAHINVTFKECPWGLKLINGSCSCHILVHARCDTKTLVMHRYSHKWIGCYEQLNGSCRDQPFVYVGMCMFCNSVQHNVTVDTIDGQCMEGRTGLVCGSCKENHSVMLGTNNCRRCTDNYRIGLLSLYLLAGMLLIFVLTVFNVTVTTGYLNGLIFYANCIHINQKYLFLNFYNYDIPRIAIAWLNLDLGIEVCFYKGMNMYQKTWLQIGYVLYMIVLQLSIVILCRRYVCCTRLFGRNVTKVLSTLFLLLFTKTERIVGIIVLSLRLNVVLPNRYHRSTVWAMDPNIHYASGKHLFLYIVGWLMLSLLMIFMLSLVFIQIITKCSGMRCFRWVTRLRPFYETFTGPCNTNFAFWPGLLLFGRTVVISSSSLPNSVPLVSTSIISITLVVLSFVSPKGVYKKWSLNMLELSFFLNLFILTTLASFQSKYMQFSEIVYVSVGFAALSFATFQLVNFNCFKTIKKIVMKVCLQALKKQRKDVAAQQTNTVTHSEVVLDSECDEQSPLIPAQVLPPVVHFDVLREPLMKSTESDN